MSQGQGQLPQISPPQQSSVESAAKIDSLHGAGGITKTYNGWLTILIGSLASLALYLAANPDYLKITAAGLKAMQEQKVPPVIAPPTVAPVIAPPTVDPAKQLKDAQDQKVIDDLKQQLYDAKLKELKQQLDAIKGKKTDTDTSAVSTPGDVTLESLKAEIDQLRSWLTNLDNDTTKRLAALEKPKADLPAPPAATVPAPQSAPLVFQGSSQWAVQDAGSCAAVGGSCGSSAARFGFFGRFRR